MHRLFLSSLVVGLLAVSVPAVSQSDAKKPARVKLLSELDDRRVNMTLEEATLKDALDRLFKLVPMNRVLMFDAGVDTKITMKLENVPFEGALVSILRSVKRMSLNFETNGDILLITDNGRFGQPATAVNKKVWADLQDVDIRSAIKALLWTWRPNYTVDQGVTGNVSLVVAGEPFDVALDKLCKSEKNPVSVSVDDDGLFRFKSAK
jgi:type II secretory pathway component HofQ